MRDGFKIVNVNLENLAELFNVERLEVVEGVVVVVHKIGAVFLEVRPEAVAELCDLVAQRDCLDVIAR